MNRLNRFVARTALFAGIACSALFASPVFAESAQVESTTAQIETLAEREVELKAEIARLRAEIDTVDAETAKLVVEASRTANELMRNRSASDVDRSTLNEAESMEQLAKDLVDLDKAAQLADMQFRLERLAGYRSFLEWKRSSLQVSLSRDDTLGGKRKAGTASPPVSVAGSEKDMRTMPVPPNDAVPAPENAVVLVGIATYTAASPAEGWAAWKRQSQAWKKAHPWEGPNGVWCTNAKRLNIPCTEAAWKKVPAGTVFLLPAPDVRVYVPRGVEAPKAIAVVPGESAETFKLDPSTSVAPAPERAVDETRVVTVVPQDNDSRWTPGLIILALALTAFALALLLMLSTTLRHHRMRDESIARKGGESECCTSGDPAHAHAVHDAAGCCKTDSAGARSCGVGEGKEEGCSQTGDAGKSACCAPSGEKDLTPPDGKKPEAS